PLLLSSSRSSLFSMPSPQLTTPLFPYTTLFRSKRGPLGAHGRRIEPSLDTAHGISVPAPTPALPWLVTSRPSASFARWAASLWADRKSTRLNSSHEWISYAVFCLKKKKKRTLII